MKCQDTVCHEVFCHKNTMKMPNSTQEYLIGQIKSKR